MSTCDNLALSIITNRFGNDYIIILYQEPRFVTLYDSTCKRMSDEVGRDHNSMIPTRSQTLKQLVGDRQEAQVFDLPRD